MSTPPISKSALRDQRVDALIDECRKTVVAQLIGPFGLSEAMFEDKAGGNVTTVHNFEQCITATEADRQLAEHHQNQREGYDRSLYELDKEAWGEKRDAKIAAGKDDYRGTDIGPDSMVDLDHIIPLKKGATDASLTLGMGKVEGGVVSVTPIKQLLNSDDNLAITGAGANRSKSDRDLREWAGAERKDGSTNAAHFELNEQLVEEAADKADRVTEVRDKSLQRKQTNELLSTGVDQAQRMALREAMGLVLQTTVSALYTECRQLIREGVTLSVELLDSLRERLLRVAERVVRKLPDVALRFFEGGVSGFISNLLTFVINTFVTTGARLVRGIRELLLGLYRAIKLVLFPPAGASRAAAYRMGAKALAAVVGTAAGIALEEAIHSFLASIPLLLPIADILGPALAAIVSGLLAALLAYLADRAFDACFDMTDEYLMDQLIAQAEAREVVATELTRVAASSLSTWQSLGKSLETTERTIESLVEADEAARGAVHSLLANNADMRRTIDATRQYTEVVRESQPVIDAFLQSIRQEPIK